MLEESSSYDNIVRWGSNGDSFVVLENERFTKNILPKHFKHSNFASFVRQLNKYDFHKVRQSPEDNVQSRYGPNAWEFVHPEFKANQKDSLDNIKRKAPAPRKTAQSREESFPAQQLDLMNGQLVAYQTQLSHLQDRYQDLAQGHINLSQQVVQLQRFIKNHEGVMHRVMGFLHSVDAQRRNNRIGASFGAPGDGPPDGIVDDHPASPLQKASELLGEFSAENLPDKQLEAMSHDHHLLRNDYSASPSDHASSSMAPHAESANANIGYTVGNDLETMVYPVGHTNGIDPINSEHINNIPYSLPPNSMMPIDPIPEILAEGTSTAGRKKRAGESVWGISKPRILLVEDDNVCARIGSKFLQAFECGVETARDGLEAVNKINHGNSHFDLVLMDIIMPHLDGVSATVCIREMTPQIPIIAMTSNIRADDIDMYFRYGEFCLSLLFNIDSDVYTGMNDVLPKPFTKEGMLRALEKHLPHFKKDATFPPGPGGPQMTHPDFVTSNTTRTPLGLNMGQLSSATQSLKDDASPGKSPVTASSWHSPSQLPGPSPIGSAPVGYMQQPMGDSQQYNMTPTHQHPQSGFPVPSNSGMGQTQPRPTSHRRGISDMSAGPDDHAEKRQRIYGSGPGGFQQ
ncbi:response regulator, partial [Diplocarpon rosae]